MRDNQPLGSAGLRKGMLVGVLCVVGAVGAYAQAPAPAPDAAVQQELKYAEGLNKLGLPDYAQIVLEKVNAAHPGASPLLKVLRLQTLLATGKFKAVEDIIAKEPAQDSQDVWAMKLALADSYYAWGKYPDARKIYESFFSQYPKGPPEILNEFYIGSAYKYAQMLLLMGQDKAALDAYDTLMKAKLDRHVERQAMSEMAELEIKLAGKSTGDERKAYLDKAQQLCNKILWVQDVWFGKAIVFMAHIKLMQGDIDGAQKLIDDYKPQLRLIDDNLREEAAKTGEDLTKLSPMAECHYLLGVMMQEEADKLLAANGDKDKIVTLLAGRAIEGNKRSYGALQHLLTVFIAYPNTAWAADAGARADKVEQILKDQFHAQITKKVTPEQLEKIKQIQFQNAHLLFNQQQFSQAIDSYVKVLSLFPDGETSVIALGELARCYQELGNGAYVDMVIHYIGERFGWRSDLMLKAGDQVIQVAENYGARKAPERRDELYEVFFKYFKQHPTVAVILFRYGEEKFRAEDYASALTYYQRIEAGYTNSPVYASALSRLATCQGKLEDHDAEVKTLARYVAYLQGRRDPGQELIGAMYRLGTAYQMAGPASLPLAVKQYDDVIRLLTTDPAKYQKTPEETTANATILESVMFHKPLAYAAAQATNETVEAAYKTQAIRGFEDFATKFPKSQYAPGALSHAATLWTILRKPAEAKAVIERLRKDYPDSPETKNSSFMQARSLLELGRPQEAAAQFKEMFTAQGGTYSEAQILTAGNELLKAKEYDTAVQAFDRVLAGTQERALVEPAMVGKGRALVEMGKSKESVAVLEDLFKRYKNSGYTVEASFALSKAYRTLGASEADKKKRQDMFDNAVTSMNTAHSFLGTNRLEIAKLQIEVARIYVNQSEAARKYGEQAEAVQVRNKAIAAYQILEMGARLHTQEGDLILQNAYNECIPLLLDAERWQDAHDDSETYLRLFPEGKYVTSAKSWLTRSQGKLSTASSGPPSGPAGGGH